MNRLDLFVQIGIYLHYLPLLKIKYSRPVKFVQKIKLDRNDSDKAEEIDLKGSECSYIGSLKLWHRALWRPFFCQHQFLTDVNDV